MPVGAGRDRRSWPDLAGDGARKDSVLRGRVHVGADVVGVGEWGVPGRQALKDVCRDTTTRGGSDEAETRGHAWQALRLTAVAVRPVAGLAAKQAARHPAAVRAAGDVPPTSTEQSYT